MKEKLKLFYSKYINYLFLLFIIIVGTLLPLYYNDYYFDMLEAKNYMFVTTFEVILPFIIIFLFLKTITKTNKKNNSRYIIPLIIFLFFSLISTLLSFSPSQAFSGVQGWYIGFFTICSLILSVILFCDIDSINKYYFIPVIVALIIVYLLTILDTFELDILNFRSEISVRARHNFLSTIGNINWFVGYLSLTVPCLICLFMISKKRNNIIIFGFLASLGIINIAFIGADSIYLGLGLLSFFVIPFIFNSLQSIKRFSIIFFIYSISLYVARILDYPMFGYCAYTRKLYIIIPCLIISIILYILSKVVKENTYNKISRSIIICIELLLVFFLLSFIIYTILNIDNDWGTGRLIIWNASFQAYKKFSLKRKLFGLGPEMINNVYSSISSIDGGICVIAHSEPIQTLLSMGLFGLLSYYLLYLIIFIDFIKYKLWKRNNVFPFVASIICYFGQSFVNSATTVNVCTLALVLILYLIYSKDKQEKQ